MRLTGDPEFGLAGVVTYCLEPGQRTAPGSLVLSYSPSAVETNRATVTFADTGDGDAERTNAMLTVVGAGTEERKRVTLFGCGAEREDGGHMGPPLLADCVLFCAAALILTLWRRLRPRNRKT